MAATTLTSPLLSPISLPQMPPSLHLHLHRHRFLSLAASAVRSSDSSTATWTRSPLTRIEPASSDASLFHVTADVADLAADFTVPGQYVQLRIPSFDKPSFLAIASPPTLARDKGQFEFLVKKIAGSTAEVLCGMRSGEEVEIGPVMGRGFDLERIESVDEAETVLIFATGSGIRENWKEPIKMYNQYCSRVPLIKLLVERAGWHRFMTINTNKSSVRLVEALVERWWDTTHTFHLPCGELSFTPLDWVMLTRISIGIGDLPPYDNETYSFEVVQQRFFSELIVDDWKSQGIRVGFLKNYFTNTLIEEAQSDRNLEMKIARAFFMFFLGAFLFTNGAGLVRCGWLAAVVDLSIVGKYDWGSYALTLLYLSLDSYSRLKLKSFNGPWQVLKTVWYLGDHCIRQLTGYIAIPKNPYPLMHFMASNTTLPKPVEASPFVRRVEQFTYDQYWANVSIGPIMSTLSHASNVDFIGPTFIRDTSAQLPYAAPPCWLPAEYPTQSIAETLVLLGQPYVEVPLFQSGTVMKNLDSNVNVPFHQSGQPTYEELYTRCQQFSNIEPQLRRMILSEMVLRKSIPAELRNARRSVSMGRAFHFRHRPMNPNLNDTGASTSTYVPKPQYSYEE